jgi:hypothetical protein
LTIRSDYDVTPSKVKGKIYIFCGWSDQPIASQQVRDMKRMEIYDPASDTWQQGAAFFYVFVFFCFLLPSSVFLSCAP